MAAAQPDYAAFRAGYRPHAERPGQSEASAIMMNALPAHQVADFLKGYWKNGDRDTAFAMLISIERDKAAQALKLLDADMAIEMLNYLPPYWSLDLAWHLPPSAYEHLAPQLHALLQYRADRQAAAAAPGKLPTDAPPPPSHTLFHDDFLDNRHYWPSFSGHGVREEIADGHYHLSHDFAEGGYFFDRGIYLDPAQPFFLEAKIKAVSLDGEAYFGLSWGRADTDRYAAFCVNISAEKASIYRVEADVRQYALREAVLPQVMHADGYNLLAVQHHAGLLYCYINGQEVHRMPYEPIQGQHLGLMIQGKGALQVDYLRVLAPEPTVEALPLGGERFEKEHLGPSLNTEAIEYGAIVSADGQTLFFSRRDTHYSESDIWQAKRLPDGQWGPADRLPYPINNEGSNSVVATSPDGSEIWLNNRYTSSGSPGGKGISYARLTPQGWTLPQPVPIADYRNQLASVSHTRSADGRVMIMAVKRPDALGNLDLYASFLQSDSTWGVPQHLGRRLNTPGQESGPFIASDNRTLYFSSDGLPGYGDADIFVARRLDDTWLRWSEPKNLGPDVNTPVWDGYYTVPAEASYAYISSYWGGRGQADLYRIKLPQAARPDPVALLEGRVMHAATQRGLTGWVICEHAESGDEVAKAYARDGVYQLLVPQGLPLRLRAQAKGFLSGQMLELPEATAQKGLDLVLWPLELGANMRINNVFFERGTAKLTTASYPELNRLVRLMEEVPTLHIRIEGHTDSIGDAQELLKLSWQRATAVRDYLIAKGIDASRIEGRGFGREKPVAPNDTEAQRQQNRRVELVVVKL